MFDMAVKSIATPGSGGGGLAGGGCNPQTESAGGGLLDC
jgi:hypothetical protein